MASLSANSRALESTRNADSLASAPRARRSAMSIQSARSANPTRLSLSSRRMIFVFGGSGSKRGSLHGSADRVRASHRVRARHLSAAVAVNAPAAARAHRARRSLCLLLSVAVAFVRLATDCPLTALPPPPKCSGNEEGAKMTGSISDFASRTCASTTVPRELAFGACSRGSVCAWATTTSSTADGDDRLL